jgi:putative hydrolase
VENSVLSDGTMTLADNILAMLDYNIVGIHGTCYEDQGIEKNTDNLIQCMANPKTFFVSHPDDGTWPLDYERLVPAAKRYGVALEVNNSTVRGGWKKNCIQNIHTYLDLCMNYRTNIVVGSDAHDPGQVGRFDEAIALLDEFGFDEELIINNSEEKFRAFIHMDA